MLDIQRATSTVINLGDHALELSQHSILIATHPRQDDPVEYVQLSDDEAYRLYTALHARFLAAEEQRKQSV